MVEDYLIRDYPVKKAITVPATGSLFFKFMMDNHMVPASASHEIWYQSQEKKLREPDKYEFRGDIPKGDTLELITLGGGLIETKGEPLPDNVEKIGTAYNYTFTGDELNVLVSDLSENAKRMLKIPENADNAEKVYNANFKIYEKLSEETHYLNGLAAITLPKAFSNYLATTNTNYSEKNVLYFLENCFDDLSGPEMTWLINTSNMAWTAHAYRNAEGCVEGDVSKEFYRQSSVDWLMKDVGSVLPAMFFALASLGEDPVEYYKKLGVEIWGAEDAAIYMRGKMHKDVVLNTDF